MKEIKLSKNQIAFVDDEDFNYLNKFKWRARYAKSTCTYYAVRNYRDNGKNKTAYMHRVIMGAEGKQIIDHLDHDSLNNCKTNLRLVDKSGNGRNVKLQDRNKIGVCGVCKREGKKHDTYQARITVNGKRLNLGTFDSLSAASEARKEAERKFCFHENHGRKIEGTSSV